MGIVSDATRDEVAQTPDIERRSRVTELLGRADESLELSAEVEQFARKLVDDGLDPSDALHVAFAEHARCDEFLTTDDRLLRRLGRLGTALRIPARNPAEWIMEATAE